MDRRTHWSWWATKHSVPEEAVQELERALDQGPPAEEPRYEAEEPRYEELGLLGEGGMGRVVRVRDRDLGRTCALKRLRADLAQRPAEAERFRAEAEILAQLQHPNLPPLYDAGRSADGRPWFTMKEVRGRTLGEALREVHAASGHGAWRGAPSGWTLHRLVEAFARVCDGVGYAHDRGVIHRDLKPDNVMLGAHGEVQVMDWGLARTLGRKDITSGVPDTEGEVHTSRGGGARGDLRTRVGRVLGTPAYLPPEQARGEVESLDARADVYALGAILHEIMDGAPPYGGFSARAVVDAVLAGPPRPPGRPDLPPPAELVALTARCMARERDDRPVDAEAVADEARAWLEGSRRRTQALEVVAAAEEADLRASELRAKADRALSEAGRLLAGVQAHEAVERKTAGWAKQDEARALVREARLEAARAEHLLRGALQHDPALPEAHAGLVEKARAAHAAAEAQGEADAAAEAEVPLRDHAGRLPSDHPLRVAVAAYLEGWGALTLVTRPEGAAVDLFRYEERDRRLVPVHARSLGRTPLREVALPRGSWLLRIDHPGHTERGGGLPVHYPVFVGRGEHWDGIGPGETSPRPIRLPRVEELGADDRYVPAGWFQGGSARVDDNRPARHWVEGVVIGAHPVTHRNYLAFLDDLVARGLEEEASRWVPQTAAGVVGQRGLPLYGRTADGRFELRLTEEGAHWRPDEPVLMVDALSAEAYARWRAEATALPWRLPGELEREKASRGVDQRPHPWGDRFDASFANTRDSRAQGPGVAEIHEFPDDESPYGVRGCAGNVRDWCADRYLPMGPRAWPGSAVDAYEERVYRGGSWYKGPGNTTLIPRFRGASWGRDGDLGFRLARSFG